MDKLDKLMEKYRKRFGDVVPVKELGTISEEQLIDRIQTALETDKLIEIKYIEGIEY